MRFLRPWLPTHTLPTLGQQCVEFLLMILWQEDEKLWSLPFWHGFQFLFSPKPFFFLSFFTEKLPTSPNTMWSSKLICKEMGKCTSIVTTKLWRNIVKKWNVVDITILDFNVVRYGIIFLQMSPVESEITNVTWAKQQILQLYVFSWGQADASCESSQSMLSVSGDFFFGEIFYQIASHKSLSLGVEFLQSFLLVRPDATQTMWHLKW